MFAKHFPLILAGTMKTIIIRPRDKKIANNAAKTALLATAALATAYAVTSESSYCGLHRRDGYGPEPCLP